MSPLLPCPDQQPDRYKEYQRSREKWQTIGKAKEEFTDDQDDPKYRRNREKAMKAKLRAPRKNEHLNARRNQGIATKLERSGIPIPPIQ
jgi:chorismate mutase